MIKRIIIADSRALVRRGLNSIIQSIISTDNYALSLEGETDTASGLIALLDESPADILLMGLRLKNSYRSHPINDHNGTQFIRHLKIKWPNMTIVVISPYPNHHIFCDIRDAGARALISYDSGEQDINSLLKSLLNEEMNSEQQVYPPTGSGNNAAELLLDPYEVDLLNMLFQGVPNGKIKAKMKASQQELISQKKKIMLKFHAKNEQQLYNIIAEKRIFELSL